MLLLLLLLAAPPPPVGDGLLEIDTREVLTGFPLGVDDVRVLVLWLERMVDFCVVSVIVIVLVTVFTLELHEDVWLSHRRLARTAEVSASVSPITDDTSRMAERRIGNKRTKL